MKCSECDIGSYVIAGIKECFIEAFPHLNGGLPGEGDYHDALRRHAPILYKVSEPLHYHGSFIRCRSESA